MPSRASPFRTRLRATLGIRRQGHSHLGRDGADLLRDGSDEPGCPRGDGKPVRFLGAIEPVSRRHAGTFAVHNESGLVGQSRIGQRNRVAFRSPDPSGHAAAMTMPASWTVAWAEAETQVTVTSRSLLRSRSPRPGRLARTVTVTDAEGQHTATLGPAGDPPR